MVCLEFEPEAAGWWAQTDPMIYLPMLKIIFGIGHKRSPKYSVTENLFGNVRIREMHIYPFALSQLRGSIVSSDSK